MNKENSPNKYLFKNLFGSGAGDFSFKMPGSDAGNFFFKNLFNKGGQGGDEGGGDPVVDTTTDGGGEATPSGGSGGGGNFLFKNLFGGGGGAGVLGALGSAATPIGIGLSLAGSVIGAASARKQERRAAKQAKKAKQELKEQESIYKNLDISNPYMDMENVMEDLTINQKQADFEKQQFQQSQANILDNLRGAAGGSGVAALAQTLAREGQLASQRSAADIGRQERQNQIAERNMAASIQSQQIQGELDRRAAIKDRSETFYGMAQQNYAAKREQQAAARQAKMDAITGGIAGAADMFAGFGQGE